MPTYEAVYVDGTIAAFEADALSVEHGLIVLHRKNSGAGQEPVCVIGSTELLFIRDTTVGVELTEGESEWEEEEV